MSGNYKSSMDKLNKQIDALKKEVDEDTELYPTRKKKKKSNTRTYYKTKKKKSNYVSKNIRDNIIVDDKTYKTDKKDLPVRENIKVYEKEPVIKKEEKTTPPVNKEEGLSVEETQEFRKLEKEIRSLYDKVNDISNDLEYTKTVEINPNVIVRDESKVETKSKLDKKLDDLEQDRLDILLRRLATIFSILLVIFILFIIFISLA